MTNTAINLKFFKQTDKMMDNMLTNTWWFVGMGACVWVCGWIQSAGLMTVANRVSNRMRIEFFRAILRQDIGYFDVHSSAEDSFQLNHHLCCIATVAKFDIRFTSGRFKF